jgi:hypothetical protein
MNAAGYDRSRQKIILGDCDVTILSHPNVLVLTKVDCLSLKS